MRGYGRPSLEADASLQREVYWNVGNLLNLEADLLYFDTTFTYIEIKDGG